MDARTLLELHQHVRYCSIPTIRLESRLNDYVLCVLLNAPSTYFTGFELNNVSWFPFQITLRLKSESNSKAPRLKGNLLNMCFVEHSVYISPLAVT